MTRGDFCKLGRIGPAQYLDEIFKEKPVAAESGVDRSVGDKICSLGLIF